LIVNVASRCGYTPQYAGLEALYEKYKDKGFYVLGFPCNQFGGQEPGTNEEIKQFCSSKYQVTFPLFDKIEVNGPNRHPLYLTLAGKDSSFPGDIKWNFSKFLIGRDGKVLKRFESGIKPNAAELTQAIESALAAQERSPPPPPTSPHFTTPSLRVRSSFLLDGARVRVTVGQVCQPKCLPRRRKSTSAALM